MLAAEQRRIRNTKESREELSAIIEAWGEAKQVEEFFDDVQRRAAELNTDAREEVLNRLQRARSLLEEPDALQGLRVWRTPEER